MITKGFQSIKEELRLRNAGTGTRSERGKLVSLLIAITCQTQKVSFLVFELNDQRYFFPGHANFLRLVLEVFRLRREMVDCDVRANFEIPCTRQSGRFWRSATDLDTAKLVITRLRISAK